MALGSEYLPSVLLMAVWLLLILLPINGLLFLRAMNERQQLERQRKAIQSQFITAARGRRRRL
jgi:hypothetical protein